MKALGFPLPESEPPELRQHREAGATWDEFRDAERGKDRALARLQELLVKAQRGLCAYCEINIHNAAPIQVEHFQPCDLGGPHLELENLLACCLGGTAKQMDRPKMAAYRGHHRPGDPPSCGQAKDNLEPAAQILDPRRLPRHVFLFWVDRQGVLNVDEDACKTAGIAVGLAESSLRLLNLNSPGLKYSRRQYWQAIVDALPQKGTASLAPALDIHLGLSHGFHLPFWTTAYSVLVKESPTETADWLAKNQSSL